MQITKRYSNKNITIYNIIYRFSFDIRPGRGRTGVDGVGRHRVNTTRIYVRRIYTYICNIQCVRGIKNVLTLFGNLRLEILCRRPYYPPFPQFGPDGRHIFIKDRVFLFFFIPLNYYLHYKQYVDTFARSLCFKFFMKITRKTKIKDFGTLELVATLYARVNWIFHRLHVLIIHSMKHLITRMTFHEVER